MSQGFAASDLIGRSCHYELSLLEAKHLSDDLATVLIPRSKTDLSGEGRLAYPAPRTRKLSGKALSTSAIRRLVKRAALHSDQEQSEAMSMSGHSMRVGAAQDMMTAGLDHLAIMQAGGWKTLDVVARYVENAAAQNLH